MQQFPQRVANRLIDSYATPNSPEFGVVKSERKRAQNDWRKTNQIEEEVEQLRLALALCAVGCGGGCSGGKKLEFEFGMRLFTFHLPSYFLRNQNSHEIFKYNKNLPRPP
ncbi:hypothetical protein Pint_17063 [Pistacia integerrima]|uniref:Uncharacterized protein n=1 Tax=Pistacia integerrima TaxID=434235 RepID=A0ACC0ZFB7_9ROSI|nr:hypothetical protein Pint_17063 [Pistacia integerrima]